MRCELFRLLVLSAGIIISAVSPSIAGKPPPTVSKDKPKRPAPYDLLNLKAYPIAVAYSGGALKASCNTKKTASQASNVVTLHLSAAQLGHLADQQSCSSDNGAYGIASCLVQTDAVQKCNNTNTQCIDDDGGTNAVIFQKITSPTGKANYSTPLDINLIGKWKTVGGKAAPWLLKISLDDAALSFYRGSSSTDPTAAVQRGSSNGTMFDCMQSIVSSNNKKTIELRVTQMPLGGQPYITDSLNIGVVVTDQNGLQTPVIIDPKMQNNG